MKKKAQIIAMLGLVLFAAGVGYLAVAVSRHGFSAREKPSRLEEFFARHARKIATPAGAKQLQNPYSVTPESLQAAREHWVDHCASCHALDGSGNSTLGRNLYPPAPDMRAAVVQELSDGELYYIIRNGVRFTGMPAWGGEHTPEETWQLVAFIRRLPTLTPAELELMKESAAGEGPSRGPDAHKHGLASKPHSDNQSAGQRRKLQ